ncbi:hypothetical protein [Streptomyces sp. NBC_00829]|uniref:hypothetical protein n=1 Tax=Streptomyces sp. NBC_00829 TaxID=2903679 RepID=UPI00386A9AE0|nr:hypothetical protein OG293_23365 [Streptomyces sp. NBC_00829]
MSAEDFDIDPEETAAELRDQAMGEDGYRDPRAWRPMRHPLFRPTVEHFKANPLPSQREAGAA